MTAGRPVDAPVNVRILASSPQQRGKEQGCIRHEVKRDGTGSTMHQDAHVVNTAGTRTSGEPGGGVLQQANSVAAPTASRGGPPAPGRRRG
jgi:hypothetical protein